MIHSSTTAITSCNEFEKLLLEEATTTNTTTTTNSEISFIIAADIDTKMANAMLNENNLEYVKSSSSSDLFITQPKETTSDDDNTEHLMKQQQLLLPIKQEDGTATQTTTTTLNETVHLRHHHHHHHHTAVTTNTESFTTRKPSAFRSVLFDDAPPRVKRQRVENATATATKQVVQALNMSFSKQDRIIAVNQAKDAFFHEIQLLHDKEIQHGADEALVKHLAFLAFKTTFRRRSGIFAGDEDVNSLLDEASLALEALELVYRASSDAVSSSFRRLGPELLHALVTIIDGELSRRKYGVAREMNEIENAASHAASANASASAKSTANRSIASAAASDTSTIGGDESIAPNDNSSCASAIAVPAAVHAAVPAVAGHHHQQQPHDTIIPMRSVTPTGTTTSAATVAQHPSSFVVTVVQKGTQQGDLLLRSATKIFGHLARVGAATKPMAYFPGVLGCVLQLISSYWYESIPWEARLSSLWTLANLACNTDNMQMMVCTPGLVRSLVCMGCRSLHPRDSMELTMEVLRSRSITSRAVMNLSWLPENKIPLSENATLVELLMKFAVLRKLPPLVCKSRTVRDILLQTRRHSVSAIRNLAAAPRRNKIRLCQYQNGYLLDVLTDVALNDTDDATKDCAFAAIHNLAVHDTAVMMVERPALVLALKGALLSDYEVAQQHDNCGKSTADTPKSHASATLLVLERTITPGMECYQHLRDLLEAVNPTVPSDCEEEDDNDNNTQNDGLTSNDNNNDAFIENNNNNNNNNTNGNHMYTDNNNNDDNYNNTQDNDTNNMNDNNYNNNQNDNSTYTDDNDCNGNTQNDNNIIYIDTNGSTYNKTTQSDYCNDDNSKNSTRMDDSSNNNNNKDEDSSNNNNINPTQPSVKQHQKHRFLIDHRVNHRNYEPLMQPTNIEAV